MRHKTYLQKHSRLIERMQKDQVDRIAYQFPESSESFLLSDVFNTRELATLIGKTFIEFYKTVILKINSFLTKTIAF